MNAEKAYEAYRTECAKRDGWIYIQAYTPLSGYWIKQNAKHKKCYTKLEVLGLLTYRIFPHDYVGDNDIDRIVRLLSDEELFVYSMALCKTVSSSVKDNNPLTYSISREMLRATAEQKRMALYKVFGIKE